MHDLVFALLRPLLYRPLRGSRPKPAPNTALPSCGG